MKAPLYVFCGRDLIGTLHDENGLTLKFSSACIEGFIKNPFENIIPAGVGVISGQRLIAYFENLLPEGAQRMAVEKRFAVSSTFGLLSALSGETIGALTLSRDQSPQTGSYVKSTWKDAVRSVALNNSSGDGRRLQSNMISGAQAKILLGVDPVDGSPLLPLNGATTTHILKPDIMHPTVKVWSSALNEALVMKLGDLCTLGVANTKYIQEAKSCLVERFDRVVLDEGTIHCLHQTDFCQELSFLSDRKYEKDGGPSFSRCYELVREKSSRPAVDCSRLLKWLFFNLYVGNHDSHAKNLSFLHKDGEIRLSPFYDQMCTSVYKGFTKTFAFNFGGTFSPGEVKHEHLLRLATELKVSPSRLGALALETSELILNKLEGAISTVANQCSTKEEAILTRIGNEITTNCQKLSKRMSSPASRKTKGPGL